MARRGDGYCKISRGMENIKKWLSEVEHPAKGDKNIVELGMVENIEVSDGTVTVTLSFSKHRDPDRKSVV